ALRSASRIRGARLARDYQQPDAGAGGVAGESRHCRAGRARLLYRYSSLQGRNLDPGRAERLENSSRAGGSESSVGSEESAGRSREAGTVAGSSTADDGGNSGTGTIAVDDHAAITDAGQSGCTGSAAAGTGTTGDRHSTTVKSCAVWAAFLSRLTETRPI